VPSVKVTGERERRIVKRGLGSWCGMKMALSGCSNGMRNSSIRALPGGGGERMCSAEAKLIFRESFIKVVADRACEINCASV
jgi:hypothetical protein